MLFLFVGGGAMSGILTGDLFVVDLSATDDNTTLVEDLRGEHVLELGGGFARTVVLTGKGVARVVVPGSSEAAALVELGSLDGQLAQVAFGLRHTLALTHGGQVFTVGDGRSGQLGHGMTEQSAQPRQVSILANRAVAQVACGKGHSLALTIEGNVYSWGAGEKGQLGLGRPMPYLVPRYLSAMQSTPISLIAAGVAHTVALSVYGNVYAWGEALCGQLGLGKPLRSKPSPVEVPGLPDVKSVSCGEVHTAALSAAGELYCWGQSTRGPPLSRKTTSSPEKVDFAQPIATISCGGGSTVAITERGEAVYWSPADLGTHLVPLPTGAKASRAACSGDAAVFFVETSIGTIRPVCCPLRGGCTMEVLCHALAALRLSPKLSLEPEVERARM